MRKVLARAKGLAVGVARVHSGVVRWSLVLKYVAHGAKWGRAGGRMGGIGVTEASPWCWAAAQLVCSGLNRADAMAAQARAGQQRAPYASALVCRRMLAPRAGRTGNPAAAKPCV